MTERTMELKTVEAQAKPTTDLGQFEAIAAAWTEDREKDIIHRGAFAQSIKQWRRSGKRIPLHWQHEGGPDKIIGHVDPMSMVERDDGLYVRGQVDLEGSELGKAAWRLVKQGIVGLSFGYLPTSYKDRDGGGRDLLDIDMFEISITPAPMHPDTRFLSAKGLEAPEPAQRPEDAPEMDEEAKKRFEETFKKQAETIAIGVLTDGIDTSQPEPTVKTVEELEQKITKEPFSTSHTSNWVARGGGLPAYIQHIAHDLMQERGLSESQAIQMAIGVCQRWARGQGNVSADTRAKAAAAIAEWEKLKAKAKAVPADGTPTDEELGAAINSLPDSELLTLFEALCARMLENLSSQKHAAPESKDSEDADVTEHGSVDPLRKKAEALAMSVLTDGIDLQSPPPEAPEPQPQLSYEQEKERARDAMLIALSGNEDINNEQV